MARPNKEILVPDATDDDAEDETTAMRPVDFDDFAGQSEVVASLRICIQAAAARGESLDHVLFSGPPGLGKTTLAGIIAREMQHAFVSVTGPAISRVGDLVSILVGMRDGTVLFIDEIHRLNNAAAEILYTAMEDRQVHIIVGGSDSSRAVTLDIARFTLVGATTRTGLLPSPLLARFGIQLRLDYYSVEELERVIARDADTFGMKEADGGWRAIACRSRGTPRIAKRLLRRVRDVADTEMTDVITPHLVKAALLRFGVDDMGLDALDRRYMTIMARSFRGGPVGVETLAAALSENRDILESTVEPYLLSCGLIDRTPRGRMLTARGMDAIGLGGPGSQPSAPPLLSSVE